MKTGPDETLWRVSHNGVLRIVKTVDCSSGWKIAEEEVCLKSTDIVVPTVKKRVVQGASMWTPTLLAERQKHLVGVIKD